MRLLISDWLPSAFITLYSGVVMPTWARLPIAIGVIPACFARARSSLNWLNVVGTVRCRRLTSDRL